LFAARGLPAEREIRQHGIEYGEDFSRRNRLSPQVRTLLGASIAAATPRLAGWYRSQVLALVSDFQLELPALKGHQRAAELLPR
jgi:hypothetical protein